MPEKLYRFGCGHLTTDFWEQLDDIESILVKFHYPTKEKNLNKIIDTMSPLRGTLVKDEKLFNKLLIIMADLL